VISYEGERGPDGCKVWRIEDNRRTRLDPRRSQKLFNHSPDGFEWGYGGSGPAQLALALVLDTLGNGNNDRAVALHQAFKWKIVSRMAFEHWELSQESIVATIAELDRDFPKLYEK
jgi:Family of unknown function (DUF6166)